MRFLNISTVSQIGENPNLPALDAQIIGCLFDVCMAGCSDSKLAGVFVYVQ